MQISSNLTPENLRARALRWAEAARQQDGTPADQDAREQRVRFESAKIALNGGDTLRSGEASFDAQGPLRLNLRGTHQVGLGGQTRIRLERQGSREVGRISQDGFHGNGAFRSSWEFDQSTGTFVRSTLTEGPPQGLEALKEVLTSPGQMALILGIGASAGVFSAVAGLSPLTSVGIGLAGCALLSAAAVAETSFRGE